MLIANNRQAYHGTPPSSDPRHQPFRKGSPGTPVSFHCWVLRRVPQALIHDDGRALDYSLFYRMIFYPVHVRINKLAFLGSQQLCVALSD